MQKAIFFLFCNLLHGQGLPPSSAPGSLNPNVTQANIATTICTSGWTKTIRPSASYTNKLKAKQMADLGLKGDAKDYEEDHRVSLELGGNPTDPQNLWPEPWNGPKNAHQKDRLENAVHKDVCSGKLTLKQGQEIFLGDFWAEYTRRFGVPK